MYRDEDDVQKQYLSITEEYQIKTQYKIPSFKGFVVQGPTEVITTKKTCGALVAVARLLYNIPMNSQGAPLFRKQATRPGSCLAHRGDIDTTNDEYWRGAKQTCA